MPYYLTQPINIPLDKKDDHEYITNKLFKLLRVGRKDFLNYSLYKRSIDARDKRDVRFVCSFVAECAVPPKNAVLYQEPQNVFESIRRINKPLTCAVVGAGPAGLFAARYLSACGAKVTVIEQGGDIIPRKRAVESFFAGGEFNARSNVQFGLGGAGTFSDGKLTSGLGNTSLGRSVLKEFVNCGAPADILYDSLPHIGTDNLLKVVANLRNAVIKSGGEFAFDTLVTDLMVKNGEVTGVKTLCNGQEKEIYADCTIFACGHSARDTFEMLYRHGLDMRFKPFAVGVRIEHGREFINSAQYGKLYATHRDLGSASYKLTHTCKDGRGCYSFCMCPGGVVVAANSQANTVVVNGMSNRARSAANSNSALVVTVSAEDVARYGFGKDVFAGVRFQEELERKAYVLGGGGYVAPCQNVVDFVNNAVSERFDVSPSYPRGVKSANLRDLLPKDIAEDLAEALAVFDGKIRGFGTCGVLTGIESRTSSPIRIQRDDGFQSSLKRLYPVGEGAGYAGGIVSSAADGLRAAISIVNNL